MKKYLLEVKCTLPSPLLPRLSLAFTDLTNVRLLRKFLKVAASIRKSSNDETLKEWKHFKANVDYLFITDTFTSPLGAGGALGIYL